MEITNITIDKLKNLNDDEIISHGKNFPYNKQWENKKALGWFKFHLSMMVGKKYNQTGNKQVFRESIL